MLPANIQTVHRTSRLFAGLHGFSAFATSGKGSARRTIQTFIDICAFQNSEKVKADMLMKKQIL